MRNFSFMSRGAALAGIAGLIAPLLFAPTVDANDGARRGLRQASSQPAFNFDQQSVMRLTERDGFPLHRGIKVSRNKSMLIELPRELRDVIVSNPDIVDAVVQSSNRVYLIGKKVGQANAFFFDSNGEQIVTLEIVVEYDAAPLDTMYKRLLPGSNIKTEILNETVILTGSVRNPTDASRAADIASRFIAGPGTEGDTRTPRKVINLLQVEAEEQVMLRVQVAEVERSVLKHFGINLGTELDIGNLAFGLMTYNQYPLAAAAGLGKAMDVGTSPSAAWGQGCTSVIERFNGVTPPVVGGSGSYGGWGTNHSCLSHAIRALERNGLIKTLAEPNLTAISGESAKFLAGGEFPVPVSVNNNQIGVSFKEFGVAVSFTPLVLSEGRINLKIEAEVSELTEAGAIQLTGVSLPALKKRKASSTVELPSGGTLAMAGLISDDTRKNIDGLPGLKDLPVLGTLFRSQDFIKRETELVILVTPYVAKPSARGQMARPTDGLSPASDLKTNFLGHINRVYGTSMPTEAEGGLKDRSVGFIVD